MSVPSRDAIVAAIVKALTAHGAMSDEELSDTLGADGVDLGPDGHDLLEEVLEEDCGPVMWLPDGRWVWLPALLDGRVFTHRLSAAEVEHDMVFLDADLAPLSMLADDATYLQPPTARRQSTCRHSPTATSSPTGGCPTGSSPPTVPCCSGPDGSPT
jgi:hypothetical protein